ncbi:MAG: hypothetical protein D6744_09040, partial [Planctomycetota bacterium]
MKSAGTETAATSRNRSHTLHRCAAGGFVILWAAALTPLAWWGLPSSADDRLLFAGGERWPAERFAAARAAESRRRATTATDVDIDPLPQSDELIDLTADDAKRAAILRRFRLYSRQPDEMLTFMALQRMRPRAGDLDPGFYQYGGAYIYLIGASLGVGDLIGFSPISTDIDVYMVNPERFARFYIAARLISLAFACAALLGVFALAGRAAGRRAGWIAMWLLACAPAFLTASLEAKPHIAASAMTIWTIWAAMKYLQVGGRSWAVMGLTAGAAVSILLAGAAALAVLPAVLLVRRDRRTLSHVLGAAAIALAVFALTNPYLLHHALFRRELLANNFGNTLAMYRVGSLAGSVAALAVFLQLSLGPTWWLAPLGVRRLRRRWGGRILLPAAPAAALLAVFGMVAAGKPAEFARFLLTLCALLCIAGGVVGAGWVRASRRVGIAAIAALVVLEGGAAYVANFAQDAHHKYETRRTAAVDLLETANRQDAIGVVAEPAPYSCPPLDFARRRVVLLPSAAPATAGRPADLPEWIVACADRTDAFDRMWWRPLYAVWRTYGDEW